MAGQTGGRRRGRLAAAQRGVKGVRDMKGGPRVEHRDIEGNGRPIWSDRGMQGVRGVPRRSSHTCSPRFLVATANKHLAQDCHRVALVRWCALRYPAGHGTEVRAPVLTVVVIMCTGE